MQLWASACGDWQWMVRHITLSIEIGWWCHLGQRGSGGFFLEAGLSSVQIIQFFFFIHKAYWYGTVEEFVMFTLIYFNRSQHEFGFPGTFNITKFALRFCLKLSILIFFSCFYMIWGQIIISSRNVTHIQLLEIVHLNDTRSCEVLGALGGNCVLKP